MLKIKNNFSVHWLFSLAHVVKEMLKNTLSLTSVVYLIHDDFKLCTYKVAVASEPKDIQIDISKKLS